MSDSSYSFRRPENSGRKSKRSNNPDGSSQKGGSPEQLDDDRLMAQIAEQTAFNFADDAAGLSEHDYRGNCIHAVNGAELVADAAGVAYWPAEQALLVADLHLEKGSSFARRGQLLPPYDTKATLTRLSVCLDKWRPERVIALGDSFHDREASERLVPDDQQFLQSLMQGREWVWITGNHDPEPPIGLGGTNLNELRLGNLTLRHEPQVGAMAGEIAGHLHPKARLVRRGRSVRRSCFAASRTRMIMPSFGAYTGGLDVLDPTYDGLFGGRKFHALMRGEGQVYRIPARDLR